MSFIVTEAWLKKSLEKAPEGIVIIDVRFDMTNPNTGRELYESGHIPDAVYLDIDQDLSGPIQKHGGGHPLPDITILTRKLGELGVSHDKTVVVYDQDNGMFAGRAWWILHYLGHENVYVLDGGFNKWLQSGNYVTKGLIQPVTTVFKPNIRKNTVVHMKQVKENISSKSAILFDSRARERYLGLEEPMYSKAGHIPGAKNFFWKDVLNEDGTYKNPKELADHFSSLSKEDEIIVSCGSGISACPNILALKTLGFKHVKLYPGSFSDWISYENNQVETKES